MENLERRVAALENKVEKMLDPEHGIYPTITRIENKLRSWAIAILSSVVIGTVGTFINIAVYHR